MEQVRFARRLRGHMTVVGPGVLDAELFARGARVDTRLVFTDETTFRDEGTIDLGGGGCPPLPLTRERHLAESPDGSVRQGASVLEIDGGDGRYAGASGRITSNVVLLSNGEITDDQVAVLFIDREEE
jgi:hypothetical protein